VDTNGVTDVNFGHLSLQLLVCKSFDQIHRKALLVLSGCSCEHCSGPSFLCAGDALTHKVQLLYHSFFEIAIVFLNFFGIF
jgi:hypothetical protein